MITKLALTVALGADCVAELLKKGLIVAVDDTHFRWRAA
jgi:hypothetical protein